MTNIKTIYPLYLYQLLFVLAVVITTLLSINNVTLILTFSTIITFSIILVLLKYKQYFQINTATFLLLLLSLYFIVTSSLHKSVDRTSIFTIIFLITLYLYVRKFHIDENTFLKFINITYTIYFIFSVLFYFFYYTNMDSINQFIIHLGSISFKTLIGITGSTANIDSYTVFVLLVNIFYGKKNKFIIFMLILIILWTARFTPIVALFIGLSTFYIIRNKITAILYTFIFFSVLLILFYFIYYYHKIELYNSFILSDILYKATHGRNIIWELQLNNIIDNFTILDYMFGNLNYAKVTLSWAEYPVENSHNAFLFNFFHFGLFSVIILIIYISKYLQNFNRKSYALVMTIFTTSLTNGEILLPYNPIFLISLIVLLFITNKGKINKTVINMTPKYT